MSVKKNVGTADRILRLGASLLMIYFGFYEGKLISDQLAAILLGSFGVIIFITAIISMCPLYNLIGVNTYVEEDNN